MVIVMVNMVYIALADHTHLAMVQQLASWLGVKVATPTGSPSPPPPLQAAPHHSSTTSGQQCSGGGGTCDLWPSWNQQPSRGLPPPTLQPLYSDYLCSSTQAGPYTVTTHQTPPSTQERVEWGRDNNSQ